MKKVFGALPNGENVSFYTKEGECEVLFRTVGPMFHVCSPENHEIIFAAEKDFKTAMTILAICSRLFPGIHILTFQFLNNHVHFILCGQENDIQAFFSAFKFRIGLHFESEGKYIDFTNFDIKLFPIDSVDYARASIAYVNRNCFVLNENVTPFSYPWGASSCYFNTSLRKLYDNCREQLKVVDIRAIFHSKKADTIKPLYMLDSYACPLSFCDISLGEHLFRDERHYFYFITRKVESYKKIADSIAESAYYTDEDLYQVLCTIVRDKYGNVKPSLLAPESKMEIAQQLFYTYHAGKKQIMRMLKINAALLDSLLPLSR